MTDLRSYAPGQTGTLADVVELGPQLQQVRPAGPDSFAPPASFGQLFSAYRAQNRPYRTDFDEIMLRDGYAPIVDALDLPPSENPAGFYKLGEQAEARFGTLGQPSSLATAAKRGETILGRTYLATRDLQEELIVDQLRARRAKEPNFLPGVPDTVEGLHSYFRDLEARKRQAASTTIARGPGGLSQVLSAVSGGGFEAFHDPLNLLTLPVGGGGKTLLGVVGREALVNGVIEAVSLPAASSHLEELGEHMTAGEAVQDVTTAAAFGGLLGGTIHLGGTHLPPAIFRIMPESVQRRWAGRMRIGEDGPLLRDVVGDMDNRELAAFARTTLGERMTPDEKAAADGLERGQEIGEASPFMPGPAGDAAHDANLATTLKAIIDDAPREASRGDLLASTSLTASPGARAVDRTTAAVPYDIVDFFRSKGLSEGQAYGIAAGISAEARGGDHTALNPKSGAFGLGQWLGSRKAALIERYGSSPTRQQQLEFLWHELSGGDPGGKFVLAEKDAGRVLDAYIRRFMRPAAGAETLGDLERGMGALGRRGELPESTAEAGAGDDLIDALRRDTAQADEEALAAASSREDADLAGARGNDAADMPILRRDMFPNDHAWAEAQIAFSQDLLGEISPERAGNGPPARDTAFGGPDTAAGVAAGAPGASGGFGVFGPEFPEVAGDWQATLAALRDAKAGVVPAALDHPDIGPIDLPFGEPGKGRKDGWGLAKLEARHPEVIEDLPAIVRSMKVKRRSINRIQLEGPDHKGAVRLDYDGEARTWLLTAFAKRPEDLPKNAPPLPEDRRGSVVGQAGSPDRGAIANIDTAGPIDNPELKAFDDGAGGRADLADSLEHDYRAAAADPGRAARTYLIGDSDEPRTLFDILEELDRDRAAAAALRTCAGGGAA